MLGKPQPTWTPACPGSPVVASESPVPTAASSGDPSFGPVRQMYGGIARLRGARRLQQVQDERQGWSVFGGTFTELIALKAHRGAANGGVSGPYPWRQPV